MSNTIYSKRSLDLVEKERRKSKKLEAEIVKLRQSLRVAMDVLRLINQASTGARLRLNDRK